MLKKVDFDQQRAILTQLVGGYKAIRWFKGPDYVQSKKFHWSSKLKVETEGGG